MIRVNVADLKPGMVLAQSVHNHQGILLLDARTKITKKNIRIFKSWGENEVSIKGELDKLKTEGEIPVPRVKDNLELKLQAKFADVMDDPVMVVIFNAARKQLMKDLPETAHEKENSRP